jgi:hypothetical protein
LQIGIFVDFPPVLGPALVILGLLSILAWDYREHYLTSLPFSVGAHPLARNITILPLSAGVVLSAVAILLLADAFWVYVATLFLTGRMIEGAVMVYLFRKVDHYVRVLVPTLTPRYSGDSDRSFAGKVTSKAKGKIRRRVVRFVAVYGGTGIVALATVLVYDGPYAIPLVLGVFVALTVTTTILVDIRDIAGNLGRLPIVGLLFYVAGTELYNFPDRPLPFQSVIAAFARSLVPDAVPVTILSGLPATEIALAFVGQIAFLLGMGIALVLLFVRPPPTVSR